MKKLIISLSLLCCVALTFAQSSLLDVSYNKINLKVDNETKHQLEVFDFSTIRLNIQTQQELYKEDFEIKINSYFQKLDEKIRLIEVNPSKNTILKTYQLVFELDNNKSKVDIDFSVKNSVLDHFVKLQFSKKEHPLDISVVWKTPIQANKEDKTGIETILPKYVVNLEINSSEPLLQKDFKILLNGSYQKEKVAPRPIKAKSLIGKDGKTIYQYDYVCEVKLYEGINKVKLQIETKHYVPNQQKSYSSTLFLNKVDEEKF